MISKLKSLKLEHLILGTLLVYVTLHVLEEWLFGFPAWALRRRGIPGYERLSWKLVVLSIVCGLLYWGVPMTLFIEVDKVMRL